MCDITSVFGNVNSSDPRFAKKTITESKKEEPSSKVQIPESITTILSEFVPAAHLKLCVKQIPKIIKECGCTMEDIEKIITYINFHKADTKIIREDYDYSYGIKSLINKHKEAALQEWFNEVAVKEMEKKSIQDYNEYMAKQKPKAKEQHIKLEEGLNFSILKSDYLDKKYQARREMMENKFFGVEYSLEYLEGIADDEL